MIYLIIVVALVLFDHFYLSAEKKPKTIKSNKTTSTDNSTYEEKSNDLIEPKIDNRNLLKKALNQFHEENFKSAIVELDKLIEKNNYRTCESFQLRAMVCDSLEFFVDAIDDFDEAIQMDRTVANNFFMRGLAHQKIGNFTKAHSDFEMAVSLDPLQDLYKTNFEMLDLIHPAVKERIKQKVEKNGLLKRRIKYY